MFKRRDALLAKVREKEPQAHLTFHPDGELYQVHVWGRLLGQGRTGYEALEEAIRVLTRP